jgi:multidrug efflux pump subunit AcrA (membrane-fusion protein)
MVRWVQGLGWLVLAWIALAGGGLEAGGQEKKSEPKLKGPTCKVEKGLFRIEVPLKGVFEAEEMTELAFIPKAWTQATGAAPLTVVKAAEHGSAVKKGDFLVQIDQHKIDRAIKDLREERTVSEAALRQAQDELAVLEKSSPVELTSTERAKKIADEDLDKFLKVDRPLDEETARKSLESAEFYLESAQEELKQLQKMYRDKDLTEETEEFILRRHKHDVRMAEFSLKSARIHTEQALKLELPRREASLREAAVKQDIAWEKARTGLPLTLNQKRLALQKMNYDFAKSGQRLEELEKDREAMTVRAPADGIVYYGKPEHGQWNSSAASAGKLLPGGTLTPDEVFLTIVRARPVFVRAVVEEKDLHLIAPGSKGRVNVAGYPDIKLPGEVKKISAIPRAPGSFDAHVAVEPGEDARMVMPGMACTVKIAAYHKDGALTVPDSAVFSDRDDDSHYVYLAGKGERRTVKVGKTWGGKTEILEGLQDREEIFSAKPQPE